MKNILEKICSFIISSIVFILYAIAIIIVCIFAIPILIIGALIDLVCAIGYSITKNKAFYNKTIHIFSTKKEENTSE